MRDKFSNYSDQNPGPDPALSPALPAEQKALVDALLLALAGSKAGVALYDAQDRLQFANESFRRVFAIPEGSYPRWEDIMRHSWEQRVGLLINTTDIDAWIADIGTRRGVQKQRAFDCDLVNGGWYRMHETVTDDGWMLCIAIDISGLKSHERQLADARDDAIRTSQLDELTGVFNRRFIFARLEEMLAQVSPTSPPLSVVVLDLDHFKKVNDSYGHQAGDAVLLHFCRQLRASLRPSDGIGRVGGEEFLLLLPHTSPEAALTVLERLRIELALRPMLLGEQRLPTPFSAGIAIAAPGEGVAGIYRRADQALYRAKESGRNRDVLAESAGS